MTDKQRADRNKELIREIVSWYDSDMPSTEKVEAFFFRLGDKYKLSERNIYQILENNAVAIKKQKEWESVKRSFKLKRLLAGKNESKKDPVDIIEQLRREDEDGKVVIDQSQHSHYAIDWTKNGREVDKNRLLSALSPIGHTRTSGEVQGGGNGQEMGKDNGSD